jgi:hypothetical protein
MQSFMYLNALNAHIRLLDELLEDMDTNLVSNDRHDF